MTIFKKWEKFYSFELNDILYLEKAKNYAFFYSEQLAYKNEVQWMKSMKI